MTPAGRVVRVKAWPIADSKARYHLADPATVEIEGRALCGIAVKERAEPPWEWTEWCPRCADLSRELLLGGRVT